MSEQGKKTEKKEKAVYTKEQILKSERFQGRADLSEAVLEADRKYTLDEAEGLLEKYLKGRAM